MTPVALPLASATDDSKSATTAPAATAVSDEDRASFRQSVYDTPADGAADTNLPSKPGGVTISGPDGRPVAVSVDPTATDIPADRALTDREARIEPDLAIVDPVTPDATVSLTTKPSAPSAIVSPDGALADADAAPLTVQLNGGSTTATTAPSPQLGAAPAPVSALTANTPASAPTATAPAAPTVPASQAGPAGPREAAGTPALTAPSSTSTPIVGVQAKSAEPITGPAASTLPKTDVPPPTDRPTPTADVRTDATAPRAVTAGLKTALPTPAATLTSAPLATLNADPTMVDGVQARPGETATTATVTRAPTAATPAALAEPVRQVAEAIRVHRTDQSISVRLDPPELGTVTIDLAFDKSARLVTAVLAADQTDTTSLLRRQLDALQRELSDAGFDDVTIELGQQTSKEPGPEETWQTWHMARPDAEPVAVNGPIGSQTVNIIRTDRIDARF